MEQQQGRRNEQDKGAAVATHRTAQFLPRGRPETEFLLGPDYPEDERGKNFRTHIENHEVLDRRHAHGDKHGKDCNLPYGLDQRRVCGIALARKEPVKVERLQEQLQQVRLQYETARDVEQAGGTGRKAKHRKDKEPADVRKRDIELTVQRLVIGALDKRERGEPEIQDKIQVGKQGQRERNLTPGGRTIAHQSDTRNGKADKLAYALGDAVHARIQQ